MRSEQEGESVLGVSASNAGLPRHKQVPIILQKIESKGGVAQIGDIYKAIEDQIGQKLSERPGCSSLREVVNRYMVKEGYVIKDNGWRITPKGRLKLKEVTIAAEPRTAKHSSEPPVDIETKDNELSQTVPQSPTPIAVDISEPSMRVQTEIYRILRDTKLVREVKESHRFQCQVCSNPPLKLSDVKLYAEGHHIKPLGSPHNGPDVRENILCVCPNCHVLLDYGAIELHLDQLSTSANHMIGGEYVDYHNCQIFRKVEIAP